ncbi:hypothetical protein PF001_g20139, partial [Phytophthora fragariae]
VFKDNIKTGEIESVNKPGLREQAQPSS